MKKVSADYPHRLVRLNRYTRGTTPVAPYRTVYGYEWRCSCGESGRVNGPKREAESMFGSHAFCPANIAKQPGRYRPCAKEKAPNCDRCVKHTEAFP